MEKWTAIQKNHNNMHIFFYYVMKNAITKTVFGVNIYVYTV